MKKYIFIALLLYLLIPLSTFAVTGEGICYDKELLSVDNYCKLDPVISVYKTKYKYETLKLKDGSSPVLYNYYAPTSVDGNSNRMYCLDDTQTNPSTLGAARSLDLSVDYDAALARAYQLYINAVLYTMKNENVGQLEAEERYIQDLNVVLRSIINKWGLDKNSTKYVNIRKQLEGQPVNQTLVNNSSSANHLETVQKWYCSSILSCKTCNFSTGISKSALKTHCDKTPGVTTVTPKDYKVSFAQDTNKEIKTTNDRNNFIQEVPLKITELEQFVENYDIWAVTNPYFYITDISCSEPLTCSLKDPSITKPTNILEKVTNNEYAFEVIITGDKSKFKDLANAKINITYEAYHILNPSSLAPAKLHEFDVAYQRMMILMPNRPQKAKVSIPLSVPEMCNAEIVGKNQIYKFGDKTLSNALEYMRDYECCNVDPSYLSKSELNYYIDNCQLEDEVKINQDCGQTCEEDSNIARHSESYVKQVTMPKILATVKKIEDTYLNNKDKKTFVKDLLKNTSNHRDDAFLAKAPAVSSDNHYCKMYTSEDNNIFYPTTAVATSGRFFVFTETEDGNNIQPHVKGKITANFHTSYKVWYQDYTDAINEEQRTFELWQTAEAVLSAINDLEEVSNGCCSCKKRCECGDWERYRGDTTEDYYYIKGGLIRKTANEKTACSSYKSYTREQENGTEKRNALNNYIKAKKARELLEEYKIECENKTESLKDNWEYYFEPDLTFYYEQEFLDGTNKTIESQPIPMEISYEAVKYWPEVSTEQKVNETTGTVKTSSKQILYGNRRVSQVNLDKSKIKSRVKGKTPANNGLNEIFKYDVTENYSVTKSQTLYYKPTTKYYSLIPSGKYITSEELHSDVPALEIGYVFNVKITQFEGQYLTWFTIENIGHLMEKPTDSNKNKSNAQNSLDIVLAKNATEFTDNENERGIEYLKYSSKCYYCDDEILFERSCVQCEDDNIAFSPKYIYRVISTDNTNPNNRYQGNWSNSKGLAAIATIEETSKSTTVSTYSDENLEYDFTLDTNKIREIKNNNKSSKYTDFTLSCPAEQGKECLSDLVKALAESSDTLSLLESTRESKWKYYDEDAKEFKSGSISTLPTIFKDKKYPDLKSAIVDANTVWP